MIPSGSSNQRSRQSGWRASSRAGPRTMLTGTSAARQRGEEVQQDAGVGRGGQRCRHRLGQPLPQLGRRRVRAQPMRETVDVVELARLRSPRRVGRPPAPRPTRLDGRGFLERVLRPPRTATARLRTPRGPAARRAARRGEGRPCEQLERSMEHERVGRCRLGYGDELADSRDQLSVFVHGSTVEHEVDFKSISRRDGRLAGHRRRR